MSQWPVKAAIALSVLCLLASIAFFVESTRDEPVTAAQNVQEQSAPSKKNHGKGVSGFSSFVPSTQQTQGEDGPVFEEVSAQDDLDDLPLSEDAWEGTIEGRVVVRDGLPDDAIVYLVQVKSFEEPVTEPERMSDEERELLGYGSEEPEQERGGLRGGILQIPEDAEAEGEYAEGPYIDPVYPDENGDFTAWVTPGEYALIARAPGCLPVKVDGITVQKAEKVKGVMLELEQGLHVTGYVRSEEKIIADVAVTLQGEGYSLIRYTDETGAFDFDGLPPGRFTVRAADPDAGAAQRDVRGGETNVSLDLRFMTISGTVIGDDGKPVADVEVASHQTDAAAVVVDRDPYGNIDGAPDGTEEGEAYPENQYAVTDENGNFELEVARDSKATLVVTDGAGLYASAEQVEPGARGVTLRLAKPPSFKVKVALKPEYRDQTGGYVELYPENDDSISGQSFNLEDSPNGEFTFDAPKGVQWLLATDPTVEVQPVGSLPANVKLAPAEDRRKLYLAHDIIY